MISKLFAAIVMKPKGSLLRPKCGWKRNWNLIYRRKNPKSRILPWNIRNFLVSRLRQKKRFRLSRWLTHLRTLEVHYILPTGVRNRLWGKLQAKNACNLSKAGFPASHYKMLVTAKILFFKYKYGISVDLLIRISTIASIVIWQQFCSHALTNCLYPFIHRSFRCGSNCGGRYESKRLLSLSFVALYVVFLCCYLIYRVLISEVSTINDWHFSH